MESGEGEFKTKLRPNGHIINTNKRVFPMSSGRLIPFVEHVVFDE